MASRTLLSVIPRRRSCASTMARRAERNSAGSSPAERPDALDFVFPKNGREWSIFLSRYRRCGVFLPSAGTENFFHLRQGEITFLFPIVEMRREPHPRFGAVIDKNLACQELAADFVGMRTID